MYARAVLRSSARPRASLPSFVVVPRHYHHSVDIPVPNTTSSTADAAKSSAKNKVPPPPAASERNFFPHTEADASHPSTNVNEATRIQPSEKVKNSSSTTVEELVDLPPEKILEKAGVNPAATTPSHHRVPASAAHEILAEFEASAYPPRSTGPRLVTHQEKGSSDFITGTSPESDPTVTPSFTTSSPVTTASNASGHASVDTGNGGMPEGGVTPVHPFVSSAETSSKSQPSLLKRVLGATIQKGERSWELAEEFLEKARERGSVVPNGTTNVWELGKR
ncbi:hypothetical protein HDU85_006747 [Gaertneriomyces sp. JEL0708]|nr:hypothetical protein HDU85_006747 [Gaertneriomyces sp. JEL0708]